MSTELSCNPLLQCRQKTVELKGKCTQCTLYWCPRCLLNRYGEEVSQVSGLLSCSRTSTPAVKCFDLHGPPLFFSSFRRR